MDIAHSASSMNFLFFCVNFLLIPFRSSWLQLVPGGYSSFHVVPAHSSSFLVLVYTLPKIDFLLLEFYLHQKVNSLNK